MEQWEPLLKERGVTIDFQAFENEQLHATLYKSGSLPKKIDLIMRQFWQRTKTVRSAREYDVVYLFREAALLGPAIFERWVRHQQVPMIFDFDDAIFVPYVSPSNGYLSYLKFPSKTATICRLSAHIMAGNPYLADYARQFNEQVTIIPTTIDTEKYTIIERQQNALPVIGWSGSFSTVAHLDTLRKALIRLAKIEQFKLRVIGTSQYQLDGVNVEAIAWRSETEVDDLRPIDIGIMPLPDDTWSRGKCGLKALQYMALGIPTVCSPVGVNADIIQHGENGFLAATEDEWIDVLTRLLKSEELRRQIGAQGRLKVERQYSARSQAPRVYEIFESVSRAKKQKNYSQQGNSNYAEKVS
jgi:glycosyltransferase involved in cell wall biosynthesis